MPQWSTAPPTADTQLPYRIVRTPPTGKLIAIATAKAVIGSPTHFYNHRTTPCEGPDCKACSEGLAWRWHGYLTAIECLTHEHFLFEFPAAAHDAIRGYYEAHGMLRGCTFMATRIPQRPNGRVTIRCKPADLERENLPDEPDIKAILCKLWGLPTAAADTSTISRGARAITVDTRANGRDRLHKTHTQ